VLTQGKRCSLSGKVDHGRCGNLSDVDDLSGSVCARANVVLGFGSDVGDCVGVDFESSDGNDVRGIQRILSSKTDELISSVAKLKAGRIDGKGAGLVTILLEFVGVEGGAVARLSSHCKGAAQLVTLADLSQAPVTGADLDIGTELSARIGSSDSKVVAAALESGSAIAGRNGRRGHVYIMEDFSFASKFWTDVKEVSTGGAGLILDENVIVGHCYSSCGGSRMICRTEEGVSVSW